LVHGNLGRKSHRAVSDEIKTKIIHLARTRYSALSDTRLVQKVSAELGIAISRETVRKLLRAEGIKSARADSALAKARPYIQSGQEGTMVLWGGITHAWLPALSGACCFMAAVDVTTLKCLAARFFPVECSKGYLWLLRKILLTHGIPGGFCQHSQSAVLRKDRDWTLDEELRGERDPSQVGRALRLLAVSQYLESRRRVTSIASLFKDFLLLELEREQPESVPKANSILNARLITRFNRLYTLAHNRAEKAWRPLPQTTDVERVCSFCYQAVVQYNNKIVLGDMTIDIPPGQKRVSYARAPVEVRQLLDGSWRVYYQDDIIATHEPTPVREPVVAKGMKGHHLGLSKAFWMYESYEQGATTD